MIMVIKVDRTANTDAKTNIHRSRFPFRRVLAKIMSPKKAKKNKPSKAMKILDSSVPKALELHAEIEEDQPLPPPPRLGAMAT
jgi:hypothetical protein